MKVQTGMRVDSFVFDRFRRICRGEGMLVGKAVQRLMEACLRVSSVALVLTSEGLADVGQRKGDELRMKSALAELRGFVRAVERVNGMLR